MTLAVSISAMVLATALFNWAGGKNASHEAAKGDFENHGAE